MEENRNIPADKAIMHYNYANRRMLIALLAVCITFILTVTIFVAGYTEREKNWLEALIRSQQTPVITEVADGTQQR